MTRLLASRLRSLTRRWWPVAGGLVLTWTSLPTPAASRPTWPTPQCVSRSAAELHVPVLVLLGILKVEGGYPGEIRADGNGSFDMGPMQINSVWLHRLASVGVTERALTDNGCLNLEVGAAILALQLQRAHGNLARAVGWYHSRTPRLANGYRERVVRAIEGFDGN